MSSCQNIAKAQGPPLRKSNPALSSTKTPMQKGSWYTPMENLSLYYFLSRIRRENLHLVNHWYLKMTFPLSFWLGMLSLPCSIPGETPNSPAPIQGSIKAKEKGRWTDQTILLCDLWVQTHHNKLCNLKRVRMETKIRDYCFWCLCWPVYYYCSGGNQRICHEKKECVGFAIDPYNSCLRIIIPSWNIAQKSIVIPELSCFWKMSKEQLHPLRHLLEVADNCSWLYRHIFWSF